MNTLVWVFAVVLTVVGATVGSVKRVSQGNELLVERLGRYHRKLTPGLNFGVWPILDEVVAEATTREQTLDIEPSEVITQDSVTIAVDVVIFWKIIDLYSAFYEIDDVKVALKNLVITTMRSKIGEMKLQETYSSRDDINKALLESLDEATEPWGVKVTRVEIQDIKLPEEMRKALEGERAALSKQRADIAAAEGKKQSAIAAAEGQRQAAIKQAEAIAESVKRIADALPTQASAQDILRYLAMQNYVDANLKLGQSDNSKVVFMNPRDINENIDALLRDRVIQPPAPTPPPPNSGGSGQNGNPSNNPSNS
jgi:regulator of protease activity HflC (stomatin/prohibitin superfamily)